jgi:hypothetical protein
MAVTVPKSPSVESLELNPTVTEDAGFVSSTNVNTLVPPSAHTNPLVGLEVIVARSPE